MKKSLKNYHVNVSNSIPCFGWYALNQVISAYSLKDCISRVNILFPFDSTLFIIAPNYKIYRTSGNRKTIIRY